MTTAMAKAEARLRIGDVAEQTGTTPRTIRYYEEIGLLTPELQRRKGSHRSYTANDVERVNEVMRLRDLLGLSLEQLTQLVEIEAVRRQLKGEWAEAKQPDEQRRILREALKGVDAQLALVQERQERLAALAGELGVRRKRIQKRLRTSV
jgi:DNA-binding transcriptional MerR regulator